MPGNGRFAGEDAEAAAALIRRRRRPDGGFVEFAAMDQSGVNPTAAALAILRVGDALDEPTRAAAIRFLAAMQAGDGGFRAHGRIPAGDLLSTFSGLAALADMDALDAIDLEAAHRYALSLACPGGGFLRGGLGRSTGRRVYFLRPGDNRIAMTQLIVEDLCKEFPTRGRPLVVLRHFSLAMTSGENLAIVGPSGSGKSTLLSILGTLLPPSSGRVALDGQDPFALAEPQLAAFRNRRIGFVFQEHYLLPQCSVLENVLTPTIAAGATRAEDVARARMLLDRVGLGDRLEHRPAELSGGERQRAAVARRSCVAPISSWPTSRPGTSTAPPPIRSAACSSNCSATRR